ncbi:MAG: gliding motility-associated C-terminal domain-containing protein [Ferruginibacter sp.]
MTPDKAIPVCGTSVFHQDQVVNCAGSDIAQTSCQIGITSSSSFWYKFTCYQTGSLGFLISGLSASDDYDWVLFDITGRNPNDVFSNASLAVSVNIYGASSSAAEFPNSPTGCRAGGVGNVHCEGSSPGNSPFNVMPTIANTHEYILMVTNWSRSTAGYDLSFSGGTAVITDPLLPHLKSLEVNCDAKEIRIKLNKKMKCNSLAPNGSDFSLNSTAAAITSIKGTGCTNGFDTDSLIVYLSNPLPPGTYTIKAVIGSDNNTILDNCDRGVPVNESLSFTVIQLVPTAMDSIEVPGCAPKGLNLYFNKNIQCGSVDPAGGEFILSGPSPATITGANMLCSNNYSKIIGLTFSQPLVKGGVYTVTLKKGFDGNSIVDECGLETPESSIRFTIKDTVNADFTFSKVLGCSENSVSYFHPGGNQVNFWHWTFDSLQTSDIQNPVAIYRNFRDKITTLIVSNGVCSDTSSQKLSFDNLLVAAFTTSSFICPLEPASFKNQSEGNILDYRWDFGNGNTSILRDPSPQVYPVTSNTRNVPVKLIVHNRYGCYDSVRHFIKVINNCYIDVPSAFTPNGDGLNDYLYPLNAYKAKDLTFAVFNRFGQRVFYTNNWQQQWDGKVRGQGADPGTYVWFLNYIHTDTNIRISRKGTVILIR